MARRLKWRGISIHRNYTVDEAAQAVGVCKGTVRRWARSGGLLVMNEQKPMLILGADLIAFLKARRKPKQKCALNESYCLKCRCPKIPAYNEGEFVDVCEGSANIRMLCGACATIMHKRFSARDLIALNAQIQLSAPQALRHLIETAHPCLNVHFE